MNRKSLRFIALGAIVLVGFASCAKANGPEAMMFEEGAPAKGRAFAKVARAEAAPAPANFAAADVASAPATEAAAGGASAVSPTPQTAESETERKLIRSANLRLRVTDLGAAEAAAQKLIAGFRGYVASSNKTEESLSMSLRVPRASFDAALAGIEPLGKELWRNVNTEDVTLHWYDLSGRLETKQELLKTLRGYLKSAKSIEDIMAVETRLADLQNEIDSLGGEFRRLADLVDFATINVEFVLPAAQVKSVEPSLAERLGDVLRRTGAFFSSLLAFILALVVFGVPIVALAALLFWLLFGKVGLLLTLYRTVARPRETKAKKKKDGAA